MQSRSSQILDHEKSPAPSPLGQYPDGALLRLHQIIGNAKANPPVPPIIPISRSTWLDGVRSGRYPRPIKLGPRLTAWRVEDIRNLIEKCASQTKEVAS